MLSPLANVLDVARLLPGLASLLASLSPYLAAGALLASPRRTQRRRRPLGVARRPGAALASPWHRKAASVPQADVLDVARPFPGRGETLGLARTPSRRWRALSFAPAGSAPSAASRRRSTTALPPRAPGLAWLPSRRGRTSSTSRGRSWAVASRSASRGPHLAEGELPASPQLVQRRQRPPGVARRPGVAFAGPWPRMPAGGRHRRRAAAPEPQRASRPRPAISSPSRALGVARHSSASLSASLVLVGEPFGASVNGLVRSPSADLKTFAVSSLSALLLAVIAAAMGVQRYASPSPFF